MRLCKVASVALLILLLTPGVTVARTTGISGGDSVVYSYQILTTFREPSGPNNTSTIDNVFTVDILGVNTTAPLGFVDYTEIVNVFNSTTEVTTTGVSNATTIFDPSNNDTYLGNIGFFPFIYTDLKQGTWNGLGVKLPITGAPGNNGTITVPGQTQRINASVIRASKSIGINYTLYDLTDAPPIHTVMNYSATTGVLQYARTWANVFSVEKILTYNLISYNQPFRPNLTILWYVLLAAIIATVAYSVATRGTRRERKVARMRKRLERPK